MARKLDLAATALPPESDVALSYESDLVASLVRVMAVWTSTAFQRELGAHPDLPDDDNAIPLLYLLAARGPRRPAQIAADLHISSPATSRLLERVAVAGLATRSADPADARASLVSLTPRGGDLVRHLVRAGDRLEAELLADWTPDDRAMLTRLVHRFADAVDSRVLSGRPDHPTVTT